jgi:TonB family protein
VVSSNPNRREFALQLALVLIFALRLYAGAQKEEHKQENKPDTSEEPVYDVGGDVKSPKLVHYVEPAFSPNSKEAFVEGTVKISTVVTKMGDVTNPRVVSGLNAEEDRTAIEALKQWKFQPGTRNGQPVNVRVTVEINFHLL